MSATPHRTLKTILLAATILIGPAILVATLPATAQPPISLSVDVGPPDMPVYDQPPMPGEGYLWTPGYWQWSADAGYFWVPGTWVQPPSVGLLWTPPYWGWGDGAYLFHSGYWGPSVGYYGGVNYGFGYGGIGYQGGRWENGGFVYNRTVNNFGSVHVTNAYAAKVAVVNRNHVSYVGGRGGLRSAPTDGERQAEREQHVPVTQEQNQHITAAGANPAFAANRNNGRPAVAATSHPAQFEGAGISAPRPVGAFQHSLMAPAPRPAAAAPARQPEPQHPVAAAPPQQRPPPREAPQAERQAPHPEGRPAEEREHEKKPEH